MNTPISAREARKNKNKGAASTLTPAPSVPSADPDVEVTGVRLTSSIPFIPVNSSKAH